MIKIAIGSDHAGFELKEKLKEYLSSCGISFLDFGTHSTASMDYPDVAHLLAKAIVEKKTEKGIIICGSGNGVNITVNKYDEIRSALCWNTEIAELARLHNDANVIALPARYISETEAIEIVKKFISTDFEGGRHLTRVNKIPICNQ